MSDYYYPPALDKDLNKIALWRICEDYEPLGTSLPNKLYHIPHYQRQYVWTERCRERFIDSIIRGHIIPSLMFSQIIVNGQEYFMVEDGQQRLTTAYEFMKNKFSAVIYGVRYTYAELPEELRTRFRMFEFQTITVKARNLTLELRIEMFQNINGHKPLTDPDRFFSSLDLPMGRCMAELLSENDELIKKYCGLVGRGKTRSGLADFAGICIAISNDETACLTTSYYKNGEYMHTSANSYRIQPFLDAYFKLLEDNVGSRVTKPNRIYGKLSSVLGLAAHSFLVWGEIDEAIAWYIGKLIVDKKYMPSTFKKLGPGDIRNCQSNAIEKRFDAIVEQCNSNPHDSGLYVDEDDNSDEE
jgi:hypothetical protein